METENKYIAVFFIDGTPHDYFNALHKHVKRSTFYNLIDDMSETKEVVLTIDGKDEKFSITSVKSFNMSSFSESTYYAIVTIKKN